MICIHCKLDKRLDQFCKNAHTKSGYQQPCKTCSNARNTRANRKKAAEATSQVCRECELEKPLEAFPLNKRHRTGHSDICDVCVMQNIPTTLICTQCGIEKPLEEYAKARRARNGRQQPCNTCRYGALKLKVLQNPNSIKARQLQSSWVCNRCGDEKPVKDFKTKKNAVTGHTQPCKDCTNLASRERHKSNPEKYQASYNRWFAENFEADRKRRKERRDANPEKYRAHQRQWCRDNPTKARAKYHRRRTRKREFLIAFTEAERNFMLQYWGYSCAVCGRQEGLFDHKLSDDHYIPLNDPACPGTIAANMVPLCLGKDGCNNSKADREALPWLIERYGKRKARQIHNAILAYFEIVRQRASTETAAAD